MEAKLGKDSDSMRGGGGGKVRGSMDYKSQGVVKFLHWGV